MEIDGVMFKAVIWDLGGVIVRTLDQSGRTHWEKKLGLPDRRLSQIVFEGEMGRKATLGQARPDDVWNWVIEQLGLPPDARPELERDFWKGDRVDQQLVQFIRDLRPRCKTALLSNAWPDLREVLRNTWHIADAFDEIVISAEVGIAKPDARIYKRTIERLNVNPEEAVFVDDFPENVLAARAAGLYAIHFQTPAQVIRVVKAILEEQLTP